MVSDYKMNEDGTKHRFGIEKDALRANIMCPKRDKVKEEKN